MTDFTEKEILAGLRKMVKDGHLVEGKNPDGIPVWADARLWKSVNGRLVKISKGRKPSSFIMEASP